MPSLKHALKACLSLTLAVFPDRSAAQTFNGLNYELSGHTITIVGYEGTNTVIVIPNTISGLPVTSIGDCAFRICNQLNCIDLTSITIPKGVTNIGCYAFNYCSSLTNITIPNTVANIGESAFEGCTCLPTIALPRGLSRIETRTFRWCHSLTNIVIPSGVILVGDDAFAGCSHLQAIEVDPVNSEYYSQDGVLFNKAQRNLIRCPLNKRGHYAIPEGVALIERNAFSGCGHLTSLAIPRTVCRIGQYALNDCKDLSWIQVDHANRVFGSMHGALLDQAHKTLILCPAGMPGAFTVPATVTHIQKYAFDQCNYLTRISIPVSVRKIDPPAFAICEKLTAISVDPANPCFSDRDGVLFNKSQTSLILFPRSKELHSYSIPTSVIQIAEEAFYCCNLTTVIVPGNVKTIGESAFRCCEKLSRVFFQGDAPVTGTWALDEQTTVFYLPSTTGWRAWSNRYHTNTCEQTQGQQQ